MSKPPARIPILSVGGLSMTVNEREILKSIRTAKQLSDFVIVTIHAHEPGNWSEQPADFLPKLAHAAIDAGADQFIGHGPHQVRGVEIYNGKPKPSVYPRGRLCSTAIQRLSAR